MVLWVSLHFMAALTGNCGLKHQNAMNRWCVTRFTWARYVTLFSLSFWSQSIWTWQPMNFVHPNVDYYHFPISSVLYICLRFSFCLMVSILVTPGQNYKSFLDFEAFTMAFSEATSGIRRTFTDSCRGCRTRASRVLSVQTAAGPGQRFPLL